MIGNAEYLSEEEKELIESTTVLANMLGYTNEKTDNGIYFIHSGKDKKVYFGVYKKNRKLRIIENNKIWQKRSRAKSTRIKLIRQLQEMLD